MSRAILRALGISRLGGQPVTPVARGGAAVSSGERLANFSFMGTEDWEDFASLSFTAMQLETISDLDHRVEGLEHSLLRIEGHLVRIAHLLERSGAQTGDISE